jgi:GntR family transcriptional regulator
MRAYDALQQGGLIAPTRGIGYFVAEGAAARALEESRREFVETELSQLFRRMDALGFTPEEITKLYSNYKIKSTNENK